MVTDDCTGKGKWPTVILSFLAATVIAGFVMIGFYRSPSTSSHHELRIGIVQLGLETNLSENLSKITRFIKKAGSERCRLVVFPEGALSGSCPDEATEMVNAISAIQKAADAADIYVMVGGKSEFPKDGQPFNWMRLIGPDGREIFRYDKLWDRPSTKMPGVFHIDGIPCNAIICADRWLRGVEELPIMKGAKVSFELSNNYANEWVPDLQWYWYVPRALRNSTYVVFANTGTVSAGRSDAHGHSAVIAPDGRIVAAAKGSSEELFVTSLNVDEASRAEASKRYNHPVFRHFWETGLKMMEGSASDILSRESYVSPEIEVKVAAVQMACSRDIGRNVARIQANIRAASSHGADVVAFPELALTGALSEDILHAKASELAEAVTEIRQAARSAKVHVLFGAPYVVQGKRKNSAFVVDPEGAIVTRYDQMVLDRPELFEEGSDPGSMWFRLNGVPSVVTIGKDALWTEIAEMAATAGAQINFNLSYDRNTGEASTLRRLQVWVNMASFLTFTVTVNAASPEKIDSPSAPADGGSAIWEDLRTLAERSRGADDRELSKDLCIYSKYSANCVVKAGKEEQVLYGARTVNRKNAYAASRIKKNPQMTPWYKLGSNLIIGGQWAKDKGGRELPVEYSEP